MFSDTTLTAAELAAIRAVETAAAVAACSGDAIAEYWALSASASVLRDYKAGRVVSVDTRRRAARNNVALRAARRIKR